MFLLFFRGGVEVNDKSCELGHQGPLCGDCSQGFSKFSNHCVLCLDSSTYVIRIFAAIALVFYLIFLLFYIM